VELEAMKEQFSSMQSQIQSLIMAFANMKEQTQFDSMAKTLYDSHILGKEATTAAKAATSTSMTTATLTQQHRKILQRKKQKINSNNKNKSKSAHKNNS
jgi:hypothetical protein